MPDTLCHICHRIGTGKSTMKMPYSNGVHFLTAMHQRNKNSLRHDPEEYQEALYFEESEDADARMRLVLESRAQNAKILARQATTQAASTVNPAPFWNMNAQALYND
ncbi:hypothetical protein K470DRAFT_260874 [Piedraia hortae CBS 480.64]|uniref:Uncharacterized protein n=1 Tax=Piedraia hortae CBS 480.64 TaxID=1314780 RepID=A0A6A7BPZ6_9PEZI|nr:hypothetical protein K470DRAFT_260874 [Piedraia hortae CBS 480.64]